MKNTKKLISLLLCFVMVFSLMPSFSFADNLEDSDNIIQETESEKEEMVEEEVPEETLVQKETSVPEPKEAQFSQNITNDKIEVEDEQIEAVVEETKPFTLVEYQVVDGVRIAVNGTFSEEGTLVIEKVKHEEKSEDNVAIGYAFDIKVVNKDNQEIQPIDKINISFEFDSISENLTPEVYHEEEKLEEEVKEDIITVESDGFSIYTVEFTYEDKEYVLGGDETIELDTILSALNLSGEVSKVEISNNDLFTSYKENDTWYIRSLQAFDTEEWMDVEIDNITYHIIVTDAQYQGWFGGGDLYWNLNTDTGKLIIRPKDSLGGASGSANMTSNPSGISDGQNNASKWPWYQYRNSITSVEFQGDITVTGGVSLDSMFRGYPNLETIDFGTFNPKNATSFRSMFADSTKLTELDLSGFTNNEKTFSLRGMFQNCTSLEKVILNNPSFKTRTTENGGAWCCQMFWGCNNLKEVDLSNITLSVNENKTPGQMVYDMAYYDGGLPMSEPIPTNIFPVVWDNYNQNEPGYMNSPLEKINLSNTKFLGWTDFSNMFANMVNLTEINLEGIYVQDGKNFRNMFFNCSALETLDLSSFGELYQANNLHDMLYGCTLLKELNLDNLDISSMSHTNNHNSQDRLLFGESANDVLENLPALEVLSAKNSKIWFVTKNSRGAPGSEYYDASDEKSVKYLSKDTKVDFVSDNGSEVTFDTLRDWVDMITDRDEDNSPDFSAVTNSMPDAEENLNNKYDLNTNGSGFLAPGVYTITNTPVDTIELETPYATYGIDDYTGVEFTVEYPSDSDELDFIDRDGYFAVATKPRSDWTSIGDDYVIDISDNPIKITIKGVAKKSDNDEPSDVILTINEIRFKDLGNIPTSSGRTHDGNTYIDQVTEAFRPVLTVSATDGVRFSNYLIQGDINGSQSDENVEWQSKTGNKRVLTNGSGTEVDYTVEIKDAKENETLVYYARDLDVPYAQNWNHPTNDACDDNLPIENVIYAEGGESITIDPSTANIDKLVLANHTGLVLKNNTVLPTGSDIDSNWSGFAVPGNAQGMNLTWSSGIACNSEILLTSGVNNKKIVVEKVTTEESNEEFTFTLVIKDNSNNPVDEVIGNLTKNDDGTYTATVKAGESVDIYLDKTWTYTVTEDNKPGWTLKDSTKTIEDEVEINTFTNEPARNSLTIKKETVNNKWGDFNFRLKVWETIDGNNVATFTTLDNPWIQHPDYYNRSFYFVSSDIASQENAEAIEYVIGTGRIIAGDTVLPVTDVTYTSSGGLSFNGEWFSGTYNKTRGTLYITPDNSRPYAETEPIFANKAITLEVDLESTYPKFYDLSSYEEYPWENLTLWYGSWNSSSGNYNILRYSNNYNTFSLSNGRGLVINNLPHGVHYEIEELTKDGWRLVSSSNTSGILTEDVVSEFLNEKVYDLTLKKEVVGDDNDKSKKFKFRITTGEEISGDFNFMFAKPFQLYPVNINGTIYLPDDSSFGNILKKTNYADTLDITQFPTWDEINSMDKIQEFRNNNPDKVSYIEENLPERFIIGLENANIDDIEQYFMSHQNELAIVVDGYNSANPTIVELHNMELSNFIANVDSVSGVYSFHYSGGTETIEVELAHGESYIIKGLPENTPYTIEEVDYSPEFITLVRNSYYGSIPQNSRIYEGAVSADSDYKNQITFINKATHTLEFSKEVSGNMGDKSKEFEFKVKVGGDLILLEGELNLEEIDLSWLGSHGFDAVTNLTTPVITKLEYTHYLQSLGFSGYIDRQSAILTVDGVDYPVIIYGYCTPETDYHSAYITAESVDTNVVYDGFELFIHAEYDDPNDNIDMSIRGYISDIIEVFDGKSFTLKIPQPELDLSAYGGVLGEDGYYTFKLKDGDSVEIPYVPDGYRYEIIETDYSSEGYATTVDGEEGREVTGTITEDISHEFENNKEVVVPTKVTNTVEISGIILIVAIFGLLLFFRRKRA